jgi:hypothetical protein
MLRSCASSSIVNGASVVSDSADSLSSCRPALSLTLFILSLSPMPAKSQATEQHYIPLN